MKKNKVILYLMIIISIILCIPSIFFMISNQTVNGFDAYYTYGLVKSNDCGIGLISGIVVISLLLLFSICYLFMIKKEKEIFKNKKQIFLFITIISFIFMLILPFLSSDIYYYIGDSWLSAKYHENPYYTSVADLQQQGINDEILDNTGYWKNTTSVYGPLWNGIARLLVTLSFGNVTVALFIFKIASYLIHMGIVVVIYRITKNRKYMLIYGINPLVLIEFLSNVHNDIYLLFFLLLALLFLLKRKNICVSSAFLALSISIKYSTFLIVPFLLIYYFRKENILKKTLYCIATGLSILSLVVLFYLPYYQDMSIFTNMLAQGGKYSQSILTVLLEKANPKLFDIVNWLSIPVFIIIYIDMLINVFFDKNLTFHKSMRIYHIMMLIFIFMILSTFQKWYILWILPTMIWQSSWMRKWFLFMTITAIIPSINYFMVEGDPYYLGMTYSIKILILSMLLLIVDRFFCKQEIKGGIINESKT